MRLIYVLFRVETCPDADSGFAPILWMAPVGIPLILGTPRCGFIRGGERVAARAGGLVGLCLYVKRVASTEGFRGSRRDLLALPSSFPDPQGQLFSCWGLRDGQGARGPGAAHGERSGQRCHSQD